jgi:hypothetical protein
MEKSGEGWNASSRTQMIISRLSGAGFQAAQSCKEYRELTWNAGKFVPKILFFHHIIQELLCIRF